MMIATAGHRSFPFKLVIGSLLGGSLVATGSTS
jgi:hypothetical protein